MKSFVKVALGFNVKSPDGSNTLLHCAAAEYRKIEPTLAMLRNKADPNVRNGDGATPLSWCLEFYDSPCVDDDRAIKEYNEDVVILVAAFLDHGAHLSDVYMSAWRKLPLDLKTYLQARYNSHQIDRLVEQQARLFEQNARILQNLGVPPGDAADDEA
jgi:ankyrin repeat protein